MMKKVSRFIYLLSALFLMTACENYLDITPEGQVKRDDLLSTADGVEDAMYGVYSQLRDPYLYGRELSYSALDVMAQYFDSRGNNKVEALLKYDYEYSDVETMFESVWTNMYKNISNVNSILNSGFVSGATEYPAKIYRGEALGLRAFMHFDLLRLFAEQVTVNPDAEGIPYATEFSLNTPQFSKASQVYDYIIADLLKAEELLSDEAQYIGRRDYMTMRQIHFNVHAVRATLARVYLTRGDYENALKYARKVIGESGCSLLKYTELKGDMAGVLSRKEAVFGVYSTTQFYSNVYEDLWLTTSFYSLNPRTDYASTYETNGEEDFRLGAFFETQLSGTVRFIKVLDKYKVNGNESQRPADMIQGINLIRLPEMHYIAAECLVKANLFNEAADHLDAVRISRKVSAIDRSALTASFLQNAINEERYKELIGEGQTFFNCKRQNLGIINLEGGTITPSPEVYVVPIPDIEFEYRN